MQDYPKTEITGVILAGGRAERMGGQDKGLLPLAGQPLVAYAVHRLRPQVGKLIINANRNPHRYAQFCEQVVSDDIGHFFGPLAGMLAALEAADTAYILSMPCDSPLLPDSYARRMYTALIQGGADLSVAYDGERLQPVFALLSSGLRESLRAYLEAGERKIDRWFASRRIALADFSDHPQMFRNINTPQELELLEQEIANRQNR